MPRNGSGTFTLVSGNPVVTGTTIESNWANTTLSDIATAMSDSLSRSGQGGMTAALRIADGTQGAPGVGFANETGTGFYRAGTAEAWAVVQGAQTMKLDSTGVTVPSGKTFTLSGGTANGVTYLNGSKVLTSGSALTFDGSTFANAGAADGTNAISATGSTVGGFIALRPDGTNGQAIRVGGSGAGADVLRFLATADAELMRLTSTGLGIGKTATVKLDVNGDVSIPLSNNLTWGGVYGAGTPTISGTTNGLQFYPAGSTSGESMRLNTSGNLGLGVTPSAWNTSFYQAIQVAPTASIFGSKTTPAVWLGANTFKNSSNQDAYISSAVASQYAQISGVHAWYSSTGVPSAGGPISFTQAMTLDASGNLAIGETSAQGYRLNVNAGGSSTTRLANDALRLASNGSGADVNMLFTDGVANNAWIGMVGGNLYFDTAGTERARITSGGDLLVGTTTGGNGSRFVRNASGGQVLEVNNNASSDPYGAVFTFSLSSPNNATNYFLRCGDNAGERLTVRSNGGIANYQANDANLSDRREKTNFAPAKSYLDTICAIPVQTFNYIDQSDDDPGLTLGVVAQDVQAVAPELVMESNWGTEDNPKMRLSIYQTDLQYALMKCIQEQQALITDLRARVAALEA